MISKVDDTTAETPTADSTYYIGSHDWPIGSVSGVPVGEIIAVIGQFDDYYSSAVEGLASTEVPAEGATPTD